GLVSQRLSVSQPLSVPQGLSVPARPGGRMPEASVLRGRVVRLEPLLLDHVPALVAAANEGRATYDFTLVPDQTDTMAAYVALALDEQQAGRTVPYATFERDRVVGSTRFLDLEYWQS